HGVSLTGYMVYCFAHALANHKMLHAYRKGNELIYFDDVDVNTIVEKQGANGVMIPVMYIVRAANHKSLAEINYEMYQAGQGDLSDDATVSRRRQLLKLPTFLRRLVWWWLLRDPERMKEYWGTVGVSNFGAFVGSRPVWGVPISFVTS